MGQHYSKEIKLEVVRLFEAGKTHAEITEALEIRDPQRTKKWIRIYREQGAAGFEKQAKQERRGRRPKKANTKAYMARLEMEVALLKKFHTELRRKQLAVRNIGRSISTETSTP